MWVSQQAMYIYLRVEKEQATWLADGQNLQDRAVKKGKDPQGKNFQNGNKKSFHLQQMYINLQENTELRNT